MKRLIEVAIAEKRIVRFRYKGLNRIGEPHVLGKKMGKTSCCYFNWQVKPAPRAYPSGAA